MPGMNHGDNVEEIYAWIDEIPFSRPKKNIPRDFSDGVLMAEVLKVYYPRFFDVHNYIPASSVAAKKENWSTLNRKVLSKIDLKLSKDVINQLANSQQGVIEKVLMDLHSKIITKDSSPVCDQKSSPKIEQEMEIIATETESSAAKDDEKINESPPEASNPTGNGSSSITVTKSSKNLIGKACCWMTGWIWPVNDSLKTVTAENKSSLPTCDDLLPEEECSSLTKQPSKIDSVAEDLCKSEDKREGESMSRADFLRMRQQVHEKNVAITMLSRKVSSLESAMKLKDRRIGDLVARISTSASAEPPQNPRPHVMGSSMSRLQRSSQTKKITVQKS